MTSIFGTDGKQTACTIVEAGPCVVTQVKDEETDGYKSVQIAYGEKKEKNSTKAELNHFAKANTTAKSVVKEFRNFSLETTLGEHYYLRHFFRRRKCRSSWYFKR